jgi:hypothetical protein
MTHLESLWTGMTHPKKFVGRSTKNHAYISNREIDEEQYLSATRLLQPPPNSVV